MREADLFYLTHEEPNKSCLLALRSIVLTHDKDINETRKFGMPCFCYKKSVMCYLWVDKKTENPYILMVKGHLLHHPELEAGKRTRMKIFRVDPKQDLPCNTITEILKSAIDLHKTVGGN